jgi:DNA/RNA endonuclease YhcR with UshA esterase domain
MEKEEKVVVILLLMTLSSLLTAYLCFGSGLGAGQTSGGDVRQYTPESAVGERVSLEAEILSKSFTYKGEHLVLQVDCNSEVLSVFIPKTAGAEVLNLSVKKGDFISVTGTISEYEGKKEIKVERKEDIYIKNPIYTPRREVNSQ